jgi:hypothetical protein
MGADPSPLRFFKAAWLLSFHSQSQRVPGLVSFVLNRECLSIGRNNHWELAKVPLCPRLGCDVAVVLALGEAWSSLVLVEATGVALRH